MCRFGASKQLVLRFGVNQRPVNAAVITVCRLWEMANGLNVNAARREKFEARLAVVQRLGEDERRELIASDQCPFPTEYMDPLYGVLHCPLCGEMVLAGAYHAIGYSDPREFVLDVQPEGADEC